MEDEGDDEHEDSGLSDDEAIKRKQDRPLTDKEKIRRAKLVDAMAAQRHGTLEEKVCWLMNHFPQTRDDDIELTTRYWKTFQAELVAGEFVGLTQLHKLTRETSIVRARAKIQNQYKLFQASHPIQIKRHQRQASEYDRQVQSMGVYPAWTLYTDETGKGGEHLVVGSIWFLNSMEIAKVYQAISEWRDTRGVNYELHFTEAKNHNTNCYIEAFDVLHSHATTATYRYISVPRRGLKSDDALRRLLRHLIVNTIEHEEATGRGTLPRGLTVFKDKESTQDGADELMLADLRREIEAESSTRWNGRLRVESMEAVESKGNYLIQLTDVFAGAVNRTLNRDPKAPRNHKDVIADAVMAKLGLAFEEISLDGDVAARISL